MHYRYRVAAVFLLGFFIDCLNIFMSAIALPAIAQQMAVTPQLSGWVANSYILGLTLIIPLSGWLAGRFGARQMIVASMLLFSLAALCCGLVSSFGGLIAWRLLQGIGGGLMIPIGQALTFNLFQGDRRARISTIIMSVALIAPALSPTLGGAIVDAFSWQWIFFSNVPFSLLTAGLAAAWIRNEATVRAQADIRGILLVCSSLAALLWSLSLSGEQDTLSSAAGWFMVAVLLAACYVRHYRRATAAVIDLSLLKNSRLNLAMVVYLAVPGVFTGVNLLAIFYLQQSLHFTAQHTGGFMMLYGAGALVAMLLSGAVYRRLGAAAVFIGGLITHSAGIVLLVNVTSAADVKSLYAAYVLMGIGGGVCACTAQTTALLDMDRQQMARGSVIWNINRQLALSLGTALFTLMLSFYSHYFPSGQAYRLTFSTAAVVGLLPLWLIGYRLFHKDKRCQQ